MSKEEVQNRVPKKETFMQGVITLIFSQVLIKLLGLVYTLYLTNREGFGDKGNGISLVDQLYCSLRLPRPDAQLFRKHFDNIHKYDNPLKTVAKSISHLPRINTRLSD